MKAFFCTKCGVRIGEPGECAKCGGDAKVFKAPKPAEPKPEPTDNKPKGDSKPSK